MSKAKMMAAKELIKERKYVEAKTILRTISHPTAKVWINKIDQIAPPNAQVQNERRTKIINTSNRVLYSASPSMLRTSPVLFVITLVSCIFIIGIPFLLLWWIMTKNVNLTVTSEHIILKHGILSKSINEIYLQDVRNVKIFQGLFQRMMGTGRIEISTASSNFDDIIVRGLPHPYKIKEIINNARRLDVK